MAENNIVCPECGKESAPNAVLCSSCGVQLQSLQTSSPAKKRDKLVAVLLAFFLGGFGIQWFYLGKTLYGILSLVLCWTGIPALISFVHFIVLLASSNESFDAKYNS